MHLKSPSRWEEANLLESQLAELDGEINALLTKRAKVRCRYNLLGAPTSVLPPETLSIIFQYACDLPDTANPDDQHRAVAMGSVSVHWREVAHSTPAIWNRACFFLKNANFMSSTSFSLLKLYFKNLGNQTVNLRLSVVGDEDENEDSPEAVEDLKNNLEGVNGDIPVTIVFQYIFKENPAKLHALFMNDLSTEWSNLFIQNIDPTVGLPNLRRIHVGWRNTSTILDHDWINCTPLSATLIPRLTNVSFAQTSPGFLIPHEQITDLHFEDVAIDRCLEVMVLCPNASELHIFFPQPPVDWDKEAPIKPVTLSRTTCLGWSFGLQRWDTAFLKLFTFPALERFRCEDQGSDGLNDWEDSSEPDVIRDLIRAFLHRSPKLAVYERSAEDTTNWSFEEICENLPDTVEEIYIRKLDTNECENTIRMLTRPEDGTTVVFPRLKVLELQGEFWSKISDHTFDGIVKMVESRRCPLPQDLKGHNRIEELGLKWDPQYEGPLESLTEEQEARLQRLVNGGLKLTTSSNIELDEDRIWSRVRP